MDIHFFNPFSAEQTRAREEFRSLSTTHQFLAVVATIFTSLAGLPFFLVGGAMLGAAVFRAMVEWRPQEQKMNRLGLETLKTTGANPDANIAVAEAKSTTIDEGQPGASNPLFVYESSMKNNYPQFVLPEDLPPANYYIQFSSNDRPNPGRSYRNFLSNCQPGLPPIVIVARKTDLFLDSTPRYCAEFGMEIPLIQVRMKASFDPNPHKNNLLVMDDVYHKAVAYIKKIISECNGATSGHIGL